MKRSSLFLAAALLAAPVARAVAADPPLMALPESPAWQLGRAFVTAYNQGDAASLARFLEQHLSPGAIGQQALPQRVRELQQRRRETGPVEIVEASGVPYVLVLNARGGTAGADVILLVSSDDPRRLEELRVVPEEADVAYRAAP
jgi:hypothetical protein